MRPTCDRNPQHPSNQTAQHIEEVGIESRTIFKKVTHQWQRASTASGWCHPTATAGRWRPARQVTACVTLPCSPSIFHVLGRGAPLFGPTPRQNLFVSAPTPTVLATGGKGPPREALNYVVTTPDSPSPTIAAASWSNVSVPFLLLPAVACARSVRAVPQLQFGKYWGQGTLNTARLGGDEWFAVRTVVCYSGWQVCRRRGEWTCKTLPSVSRVAAPMQPGSALMACNCMLPLEEEQRWAKGLNTGLIAHCHAWDPPSQPCKLAVQTRSASSEETFYHLPWQSSHKLESNR